MSVTVKRFESCYQTEQLSLCIMFRIYRLVVNDARFPIWTSDCSTVTCVDSAPSLCSGKTHKSSVGWRVSRLNTGFNCVRTCENSGRAGEPVTDPENNTGDRKRRRTEKPCGAMAARRPSSDSAPLPMGGRTVGCVNECVCSCLVTEWHALDTHALMSRTVSRSRISLFTPPALTTDFSHSFYPLKQGVSHPFVRYVLFSAILDEP